MPKSKKKKNADFQKVKLKVGRKLPRGDNITNLSFKTRQIQLTQRIRDGNTPELTTKRHLSIQDLLRQCDHHSCNSRLNAVSGLKEVWSNSYEELMVQSNIHGYGEIVKKLSTMLIDNEAVVRHSVISLFKLIFHKMGNQNRSYGGPAIGGDLFRHIHAFLCCAMNHILEDVRLDSLVLFDALLESFPQFMVEHTRELLGNLVAMISAPISLGAKGNKTTQKLSMNPESKMLAMKFRARVLQRIKDTLQEALRHVTKNDPLSPENKPSVVSECDWSFYFDGPGSSVRQSSVIAPQSRSKRFRLIFASMSNETEHSILSGSNLENFMQQSMPTLLQCWKEARATTSVSFVTENGMSSDSTDVMTLVLSVVDLMFSLAFTNMSRLQSHHLHQGHLISPSVLVENYFSDFTTTFMNQFPFSAKMEIQNQKKRRNKKKSNSVNNSLNQQSLVTLNLEVCHIMSCFCADLSLPVCGTWLRKVEAYLTQVMESSLSLSQCLVVVKILRNIFLNPKSLDLCTSAFKVAWELYIQRPNHSTDKKIWFDLFASMFASWKGQGHDSQSHRHFSFHTYNAEMVAIYTAFADSLPTLLQEVPRREDNFPWIRDILDLLAHGFNVKAGMMDFERCLTNILDPDSGLLALKDESIHSKVLSLLAMGPVLTKEHLKYILYSIRRPVDGPLLAHRKSKSTACQAIGCVDQGVKQSIPSMDPVGNCDIAVNQQTQLSNYLKFLFSLQIGLDKEELESLIPSKDMTSGILDKNGFLPIHLDIENSQWECHKAIAEYVAVLLTGSSIPTSPKSAQPFTFLGSMEHLWTQNIASHRGIHLMSAYSLMKYVHLASQPHCLEKPCLEFVPLVSLIIASMLVGLYAREVKRSGLEGQVVVDVKAEAISCLKSLPCLMPHVLARLNQPLEGSSMYSPEETQSAVMALELLKSEEIHMEATSSIESADYDMENKASCS